MENELLKVTDKNDFEKKWGNLDFLDEEDSIILNKWNTIYKIFFDPNVERIKNGLYNEIREIALYNLFSLDPSYFMNLTGLSEENKKGLIQLQNEWMSTLIECLFRYCDINGYDVDQCEIVSFTKKGGQTTSHDFELAINYKDTPQIVKIEFKFSASGSTCIIDLAEFSAINTESYSGTALFGSSYLKYFWDEGYLNRMCVAVNINDSDKPQNFEEWSKIAKSVTNPGTGFHELLRNENISKNVEKKQS